MTKARDLANLISGGFTEADIPNLSASKITSGTFADARIAASNVSQHAQSFDDNKIVNDISTLGLRVHTQENLNASNSNSASFDVFQDSSAVSNLTNCQRDDNEFISSVALGTLAEFDYNGQSTKATIKWNNLVGGNGTEYEIDNDGDSANSSSRFAIPEKALLSSGNYPQYFPGDSHSISGLNTYYQYDFKENKTFKTKIKVGKCNTWGDVYSYRFQYSTDGSNWSNWDMSGVSSLGTTYTPQAITDGHNSGGTFNANSGTSDGTVAFADNNSSSIRTTVTELTGVATITARYIRKYITGLHNGKANNNAGGGIFAPYVQPLTTSATGSFTGNNITAPSSVSKMGAVITYQDNAGTNALNTDIVLQLSADGGSNYSTATMTALPDFATGIKMAKVNDLSVTAGTSINYKISFANQASGSKEARIRGVSLQY
jgi:hypothetical protein